MSKLMSDSFLVINSFQVAIFGSLELPGFLIELGLGSESVSSIFSSWTINYSYILATYFT